MSDEAQKVIDDAVKAHDVLLFMKGTPTFPQCGFSSTVVQILDGEFVGGCDIVKEMYETGELKTFLAEKGVSVAS